MTAPTEVFPFTPLQDEDRERVTVLCGGAPPTMPNLREFLRHSGLTALPDPMFRQYLQTVGLGCLEALDIDTPDGLRDLNRGILFYAGTVNEAGGANPLPYKSEALLMINGIHRKNLAISALEEINEVDTFSRLFARFNGLFTKTPNYDGYSVALLGSGLAHLITQNSVKVMLEEQGHPPEPETSDPFVSLAAEIEYDPDMQDLKQLFDSADPIDPFALDAFLVVDEPRPPLPPSLPFCGEVDKRRVKLAESERMLY